MTCQWWFPVGIKEDVATADFVSPTTLTFKTATILWSVSCLVVTVLQIKVCCCIGGSDGQ